MNDLIMRAEEGIHKLDAMIKRLDGHAFAMDDPAKAADSLKKVGPYGIPEEIVRQCEITISAILAALGSDDSSIQPRVPGGPPKWWRDVRTRAASHRLKDTSTENAFLDALQVLDRHVSDDRRHIASLAFLVGRLDHKIKTVPSRSGFGFPGDPNSNQLIFVFDPEVDEDVYGAINKTLAEIIPIPKSCVGFMAGALDEIKSFE